MSEFAQKAGESPTAWVERLARVSTSGLSDYLIFVLTSWKRDAAHKAGAVEPDLPATRLGESALGVVEAAGLRGRPAAPAGESTPLEAAKRAVRALSLKDLSRFTFWLTHGRMD